MGLSRRKFTKEFKIAALRQLDAGVSIAAVARSCEINPNLLHRWQRDFSTHQNMRSLAWVKREPTRAG
jgi:transposase-like protein